MRSIETEAAEHEIPEWVGRPVATPAALPAHMQNVDPEVADAILQCMIGEYMWKYVRHGMFGASERRHRRYFFINPYNRTIHWTEHDPSTTEGGKSKMAHLEQVALADDHNQHPPGLYNQTIVITTGKRELKLTAPNKARHRLWCTALGCLLQGPDPITHEARTSRVAIPLELGARQGADGTPTLTRTRGSLVRREPGSPTHTLRAARPLAHAPSTATSAARPGALYSVLNDPSDVQALPSRPPRSSRRAVPDARGALVAEAPPADAHNTARSRLSFLSRK